MINKDIDEKSDRERYTVHNFNSPVSEIYIVDKSEN